MHCHKQHFIRVSTIYQNYEEKKTAQITYFVAPGYFACSRPEISTQLNFEPNRILPPNSTNHAPSDSRQETLNSGAITVNPEKILAITLQL